MSIYRIDAASNRHDAWINKRLEDLAEAPKGPLTTHWEWKTQNEGFLKYACSYLVWIISLPFSGYAREELREGRFKIKTLPFLPESDKQKIQLEEALKTLWVASKRLKNGAAFQEQFEKAQEAVAKNFNLNSINLSAFQKEALDKKKLANYQPNPRAFGLLYLNEDVLGYMPNHMLKELLSLHIRHSEEPFHWTKNLKIDSSRFEELKERRLRGLQTHFSEIPKADLAPKDYPVLIDILKEGGLTQDQLETAPINLKAQGPFTFPYMKKRMELLGQTFEECRLLLFRYALNPPLDGICRLPYLDGEAIDYLQTLSPDVKVELPNPYFLSDFQADHLDFITNRTVGNIVLYRPTDLEVLLEQIRNGHIPADRIHLIDLDLLSWSKEMRALSDERKLLYGPSRVVQNPETRKLIDELSLKIDQKTEEFSDAYPKTINQLTDLKGGELNIALAPFEFEDRDSARQELFFDRFLKLQNLNEIHLSFNNRNEIKRFLTLLANRQIANYPEICKKLVLTVQDNNREHFSISLRRRQFQEITSEDLQASLQKEWPFTLAVEDLRSN